jgi:hypothetical protein
MIQTEYPFTLPIGYLDQEEGTLHREGVMRLSTAADEILPLKDPRVQANQAYLVVILLSRVVTRLGSIDHINPKVIEALFAADLSYLQDLYDQINHGAGSARRVSCPQCHHAFDTEAGSLGGSEATPLVSSIGR